jgi:hypothetical protein
LLRKFNQTSWLLLVLFLLIGSALLQAQEPLPREQYFNQKIEQRPFNEQEWKSLTKDLNYAEDGAIKESSTHRKANTRGEGIDEEEQSASSGSMSPFWAAVFKWTIVLLAILILAVILYSVIGGGSFLKPTGKKIMIKEENFSIENIEANLHESDLDRHIREALQQNNYTLAIRLYYLAVIKELSLNKWIKWKRDKTDRDYLREMQTTALFNPYRDATRIFERVFYGNAVLNEQDFNTIKPSFLKLLEDIKKNERPPVNIAG